MCAICLEWEKGKMTKKEAWNNLLESIVALDPSDEKREHYWELAQKLSEGGDDEE